MRFVFTPPAEIAAGLLNLPWHQPLEEWSDDRIVEISQRGISRHVVRFVAESDRVYALKEIDERLARREFRLLRELDTMEIPAVMVVGVVVGRRTSDGETRVAKERAASGLLVHHVPVYPLSTSRQYAGIPRNAESYVCSSGVWIYRSGSRNSGICGRASPTATGSRYASTSGPATYAASMSGLGA